VKLGAITLQDAPWQELVDRWRRLEELGVETIWVADHLGHKGLEPGEPWFEAWSCLTALAYETSRPRIGPLVSPMTFRNPAVLARTALTVAELSCGTPLSAALASLRARVPGSELATLVASIERSRRFGSPLARPAAAPGQRPAPRQPPRRRGARRPRRPEDPARRRPRPRPLGPV